MIKEAREFVESIFLMLELSSEHAKYILSINERTHSMTIYRQIYLTRGDEEIGNPVAKRNFVNIVANKENGVRVAFDNVRDGLLRKKLTVYSELNPDCMKIVETSTIKVFISDFNDIEKFKEFFTKFIFDYIE